MTTDYRAELQRLVKAYGDGDVELVSERFEFSVFDSGHVEQAGGAAPSFIQALREGLHYLAMYSQDGQHCLELRRVQILFRDDLPDTTTTETP